MKDTQSAINVSQGNLNFWFAFLHLYMYMYISILIFFARYNFEETTNF